VFARDPRVPETEAVGGGMRIASGYFWRFCFRVGGKVERYPRAYAAVGRGRRSSKVETGRESDLARPDTNITLDSCYSDREMAAAQQPS